MRNKTDLVEAVQKVYEALDEAIAISKEIGEGFDFTPTYGMGGYYEPVGNLHENIGWNPSSLGC